jgi:uncharacterized cupredoxin-like copper-binding protein
VSFASNPCLLRRAVLGAALAGLAVLALAGCGGSHATGASGATVVGVTERDFRISAPTTVQAGDVMFRVHNEGPDAHEFLVVRAGDEKLPMRTDGLTVNEEVLLHREPGSLEPGQPGEVRTLSVHLTPGRYVLFCNMSGHYLGGMRTVLVVK